MMKKIIALIVSLTMMFSVIITCHAEDTTPFLDIGLQASEVTNGTACLTVTITGSDSYYWNKENNIGTCSFYFELPEGWEIEPSSDYGWTIGKETSTLANGSIIYTADWYKELAESGSSPIVTLYAGDGPTYKFDVKNITGDGTIAVKEGDSASFYGFYIYSGQSCNWSSSDKTILKGSVDVKASVAPSYTASYANTPADSVKAGETFTSDVVVTSDSDLSSAQLTLGNPGTAAKIISIENKLTGDNVSFDSSENEDGSWLLSFYGNEASAKDGLTVATVTYEAVDEGSASLSMTAGSAGISGDTADYDITLPEASDVTVILPPISTVDYGGNYSLIKYEPASGENFTYDGKAMYVKDGVFYSVVAEGTEADRSLAAAAEGTASAYDNVEKGDINNSGVINIIDAQIAYDISNKVYSGFDKLTSDQIVKADVNNSLAVEASDARAIQVYVHTGAFAAN